MKESHEKTLILAVCGDESIHCFGTLSESCVGDDILGNYTTMHIFITYAILKRLILDISN